MELTNTHGRDAAGATGPAPACAPGPAGRGRARPDLRETGTRGGLRGHTPDGRRHSHARPVAGARLRRGVRLGEIARLRADGPHVGGHKRAGPGRAADAGVCVPRALFAPAGSPAPSGRRPGCRHQRAAPTGSFEDLTA
jgi:hypothetical protein